MSGKPAKIDPIGLSPNGKATDSDSVIFKVRILVALLNKSLSEEIPEGGEAAEMSAETAEVPAGAETAAETETPALQTEVDCGRESVKRKERHRRKKERQRTFRNS